MSAVVSPPRLTTQCPATFRCDGCIFTEIDDLTRLPEDVGLKECCPCIWNYAERYEQPWMKIAC